MPTASLPYVIGMRLSASALLVWFAASTCAYAQISVPSADGTTDLTAKPQDSVGEPVAPYDDKLLRLAEILGSVHYLRTLCGANEGNKWRTSMSQILATENPGPKRRARLVAHFNRGYRSFSGTYSTCTGSAVLAAERYMEEGASLSRQITQRYGR